MFFSVFFFFNDPATTEIYTYLHTLSLHDALPISAGQRELLAQLSDEDVDDLELGLVHSAVKMIEKHFLGQRRALAQAQQLEHLIFLAGQTHAHAIDLDRLGVEIDRKLAGLDDVLAVALRPADDRMVAGDQLVSVEGRVDMVGSTPV